MITDINSVKEYLGIDNETFDVKISRLIPYCEEVYKTIRNAPWDVDSDGNEVYPVGSDITIANMINYLLNSKPGEANISSESINSYSVTYGDGATFQGFPRSIVGSIKKYTRGI